MNTYEFFLYSGIIFGVVAGFQVVVAIIFPTHSITLLQPIGFTISCFLCFYFAEKKKRKIRGESK